jgi:hypothetical protein
MLDIPAPWPKHLEDSLTFDLHHFREVEEVLRKIKGIAIQRLWRYED